MNIGQRNRIIVSSALFILLIAASFIFGATVFLIALTALLTSWVVEFLTSLARKEKFDWTSWLVTPLVITLMTTPVILDQVWIVAVGTAFGIFFAKSIFGGQDKNIFNPATVGLIFIALSFPVFINSFINPLNGDISTITPAMSFKLNPSTFLDPAQTSFLTPWQLLQGYYPGAIGTTFKLGILILGIILMVLRVTDWKTPVLYLGTYFVLAFVNFLLGGNGFTDSLTLSGLSLLMGHLLFASMFIATDTQTSPLYNKGKIIYGIALGVITFLIQTPTFINKQAPNTEGAIYAITFMNAVVGLIDVMTVPKVKVAKELQEVTE
jgi:Na+-transporting NADH:ubiquinone oxidoreductase subunit B